jgi:hypothetical protein
MKKDIRVGQTVWTTFGVLKKGFIKEINKVSLFIRVALEDNAIEIFTPSNKI